MAVYAEMTTSVLRAGSVEELFEIFQAILLEMRQLADRSTRNIENVEHMKNAINADIDSLRDLLSQGREETVEWRAGYKDRIEKLKIERRHVESVLKLLEEETTAELKVVKNNAGKIRSDLSNMCETVKDIQQNHTIGSPEELLELASEIESRLRISLKKASEPQFSLFKCKTHIFADSSSTEGHVLDLSKSVANSLRNLHLVQQSRDVVQLQDLLSHFTRSNTQ